MKEDRQNKIMKELDDKINHLKMVLEETIIKHSDAEYDLNDLKIALETLNKNNLDFSSKKMLVTSNEWDES